MTTNYHCTANRNVVEKSRQPLLQFPPALEQKSLLGSPDPEIEELIWRNGQVILSSQSHKIEQNSFLQEEEAALWLHHPSNETTEKEFPYFCDIPSVGSVPMGTANMNKGKVLNFSNFSAERIGCRTGGIGREKDEKEASVMTLGSSHCGNNQGHKESNHYGTVSGVFARPYNVDAHKKVLMIEKGKNDTMETTVTSSCGGSSGSLATTSKQTSIKLSNKRMERDADKFGCQCEDAEHELTQGSKRTSRSTSGRRSRPAEVHNLSERKRRDRINRKMLALQELIPDCNKTDKASMLDEAIKYLKSLQLQVQIMWMGSGLAPVMYSGLEHLMPRMGMAMNNGQQQIARVPMVDPSISPSLPNPTMWKPPVMNSFNVEHQMHNMSEAFARYIGFQSMPLGQAVNLFPCASQPGQASQRLAAPSRINVQYDKGLFQILSKLQLVAFLLHDISNTKSWTEPKKTA